MSTERKTRKELEQEIIVKAWKDEEFKKHLLGDSRETLAQEIGIDIPENIQVKVLEETPNTIYFVLPMKPSGIETEGELSEEALESLAGGAGAELDGGSILIAWD